MSEGCTHDCESCTLNCSHSECNHDPAQKMSPESFLKPLREGSRVGKVYAVVSGKGGVGKSLVTGLLASEMQRRGHRAAILDADITGPSIPQMFGIHDNAYGDESFIEPVKSNSGIQIISMNVLLEHETEPVVWRGPVIAGAVVQFWSDVAWDNVDYMFVDLPPGTGDVPLTVFQSLPIDGVIVVTSPQQLVGMVVEKAVNMADMMNKKVVAIVENMSYFKCPDCDSVHSILGESRVEEIAEKFGIPNVIKLPINPEFADLSDSGEIENARVEALNELADFLEK